MPTQSQACYAKKKYVCCRLFICLLCVMAQRFQSQWRPGGRWLVRSGQVPPCVEAADMIAHVRDKYSGGSTKRKGWWVTAWGAKQPQRTRQTGRPHWPMAWLQRGSAWPGLGRKLVKLINATTRQRFAPSKEEGISGSREKTTKNENKPCQKWIDWTSVGSVAGQWGGASNAKCRNLLFFFGE